MKQIIFTLTLLIGFFIFAEDIHVDVNHSPSDKNTKIYEITEGQEDITGDKSTLKKTAEQNWKKACHQWSAEFKKTNKENSIISYNCGKMDCSKEGVETTCTSKATHKVKVLVEE